MDDVYHLLADHLRNLVMGYPFSEELIKLLAEAYTREEAGVMIGLPNDLDPLEVAEAKTVAARLGLPLAEVEPVLERLARRTLSSPDPPRRAPGDMPCSRWAMACPRPFLERPDG